MNYNEEMKKIIAGKTGNKLLLHSCCGPCSTVVLEKLKNFFDLTVIYYNPNIEPHKEYLKRKEEQLKVLKILKVPYLDIDYLNQEYQAKVKGYEKEKENGLRCPLCYELRLEKTVLLAKANNYDYFATTLTVSPFKNSKIINKIGLNLQNKYQVNYLVSDFRKENGYLKSIELSKKYNIYRQHYCGCRYSNINHIRKGDNLEEY